MGAEDEAEAEDAKGGWTPRICWVTFMGEDGGFGLR